MHPAMTTNWGSRELLAFGQAPCHPRLLAFGQPTPHAQFYSTDFAGSTSMPPVAMHACADVDEMCLFRGKRQEAEAAQYDMADGRGGCLCVSTKIVACGTKGGKNAYVVRPARSTSSC